jgi:hypothetical protein
VTPAIAFVVRFYGPLLLAIVLLLLALSVKGVTESGHLRMHFSVFPGFHLEGDLPACFQRAWVPRSLFGVWGVGLVAASLLTDFAHYFPTTLRMDVYFDDDGLRRELAQFTAEELGSVGMDTTSLANGAAEYESQLKRSLATQWGRIDKAYALDTSGITRGNVHGKGETTFVVERIGVLTYRIVESHGQLAFAADVPGRASKEFSTFFELRDSPYNHIRPSFLALVRNGALMLRPEFKQILIAGPRRGPGGQFDHVVVGLTRIQLLPIPDFGNTVYLWKRSDRGAVPIAYAVYY